jgi:hypothetical protein
MPYRYECSECKGTFDVAEQTFPPACSLPKPKKGDLKLVGGGSVLLTPSTGCQHGNAEERQIADFFNRSFLLPHFVPGTGRGNINCVYLPRQGVMKIDLHVYLDFRTSSKFSWWSSTEKQNYKDNCLKAINENWNGRATLICIKPRWNEIPPVRLEFGITFLENSSLANYNVIILKDEDPYKINGLGEKTLKCSAYIGMQQILTKNVTAQITGQLQSFQVQTLNLLAAAQSIGKDERERLEKALKQTGAATIPFPRNSAAPTPEGKIAVTNFSWQAKQGVLKNTPLVPIKLAGVAASDETNAPQLARDRAIAIDKLLTSFNAPHPRHLSVGPPAQPGGGGHVGIALDRDFEDDMKNYEEANYNIFAHEYGHMLGLPDEYLNEEGSAAHNPKVVMQQGLVDLASKARVNVPTFGKATTSIMSYGQDVMACHFLTAWEAMVALTRNYVGARDWKINIKA